jgi:hypothetical protein
MATELLRFRLRQSGLHRYAQPLARRNGVEQGARQSGGFLPEQKYVACPVSRRRVRHPSARAERKEAGIICFQRQRGCQRFPVFMHRHIHQVTVIHPGASQLPVGDFESRAA